MSRGARYVGRSGEKRFSALCSDVGVTCNPASEDDYGWDHVVEFPHESLPGLPADLQSALPPVFVQTKTLKVGEDSVRMKLSNALSLTRSPNPCFIVLPPKNVPGMSALWRSSHFWGRMMTQTLKRAREAASKGISESEFHKRSITFKISEREQYSADDLLPWMKRTIQNAGRDYAAAKATLRESLGFDSARMVGSIEFAPMQSVDELLDHQLGLTPTIPITKFELRDRRFGVEITMPLPVPTVGEWMGTMHVNPQECAIHLRGPDESEVDLKGELLLSSLPGLPVDECKVRVKADFLDLVQSIKGGAKFNLRYNAIDKRSPANLEKLLRVVSWAGQGAIDVQIWVDDARLFGGKADFDLEGQEVFARLCLLVGPLVKLSSHLRKLPPAISIADVNCAQEQLVALYGFLTSPDMHVAAKLSVETAPTIGEVLTYGFVDVGAWRFGAIIKWSAAEQAVTDGTLKVRLVNRQIIEKYAFDPTDGGGAIIFDADFRRLAEQPGVLVMDDNAVARLAA